MDIGMKYVSRIFIYSSTFLACYLFYLVTLLLKFFDLLSVELSLISNSIAIFEILLVLGTNFLMLVLGAQINNQFGEDSMQLVQIK